MTFRRPLRHKFNAKAVNHDGHHFASKLEFEYFLYLEKKKREEEIIMFTRQTGLHLPGGAKYITDFVTWNADGTCHFIDVKGMLTNEFQLKKKIVEATYPIEIEVIKKGMF